MKLAPAPFTLIITILTLFTNPSNASTNCDTLLLINGKELLITEHKFHDNKFHYYKCDDELLERKHIIDKKSIVKIEINQASLLKEKEVVKALKSVKKVKKKKRKKKVKKKKERKYYAHLKLKDGGKLKGAFHSRTNDAVRIEIGGELKRYHFSDLKKLQTQERGKLGIGIVAGASTGLVLAALQYSAAIKSRSSYLLTFSDFPDQKESIQIAVISTLVATLVTLLVVNARVNIPLNRKNKKRIKFKF